MLRAISFHPSAWTKKETVSEIKQAGGKTDTDHIQNTSPLICTSPSPLLERDRPYSYATK